MSKLSIFSDSDATEILTLSSFPEISRALSDRGVLFEKWPIQDDLPTDHSQDGVISTYRSEIDRLMKTFEFRTCDVVSLKPDHPQKLELRKKFTDEHVHSEFEMRFFVAGRGLFYLHIDSQVMAVLCERGDLISVPAGVKHWFDMGEHPDFTCIRFFTDPTGWIAEFTGSAISTLYPSFEDYLASNID